MPVLRPVVPALRSSAFNDVTDLNFHIQISTFLLSGLIFKRYGSF